MMTLEEAMRGSVREVNVRRPAGRTTKMESYQVRHSARGFGRPEIAGAGYGESGSGGGESGDLYLRVRLAKHPDFDVDDHNLVYEAELAPWEAVLGAEISIPSLDGRVNIKIPAGTQSGQKPRVRGRGLLMRGGVRGDLLVTTRIVVPAKITDAEKNLWEQLKAAPVQSAKSIVSVKMRRRGLPSRLVLGNFYET